MQLASNNATGPLSDRYRCSSGLVEFAIPEQLSGDTGYFQFGPSICYGQNSIGRVARDVGEGLYDISKHISVEGSAVQLPFDPAQVIDNLRCERYVSSSTNLRTLSSVSTAQRLYYAFRPLLGTRLRKHLQKIYFHNWRSIPFPHWPVDTTVDQIIEQLLILSMKSKKVDRIPFIWFWPEGHLSCAIMTHDVETSAGRDFCRKVMDLDESFGVRSSFQIVPEGRYRVDESFLQSIRSRGFEINIHDLNHDGFLFSDRPEFLMRAERINEYGRRFRAKGFRSGVLFRNASWFDALDFSYEMSIPNVAHLDPQRGGCCTVLPYFIGDILELPLTTTQDYTLFNILHDHSIRLWKDQIALIRARNGLISVIVHPDYVIDDKARQVYTSLLQYLADLRSESAVWIASPGDVAAWWRLRSKLTLVNVGGSWRIEGEGSEQARIAYAVRSDDTLTYEFPPAESRS